MKKNKKFGHLTIKSIDYHRNGISGLGFHVALFKTDYADCKGLMMGVVFSEVGACAVFDVDKIANEDIEFMSNSWRGDWFEHDLRAAIKEFEDNWQERFPELAKAKKDTA
jgi:hypothetical protein